MAPQVVKPEVVEQLCKSSVPLFDHLNVSFEILEDGIVRCYLPFDRKSNNHLNSVYAGVQFCIAEVLGGIGFMTAAISGYVPLLKGMNINFVKPALTDLTAEVCFSESDIQKMKAQLEAEGRYDFELESKIQDTSGTVVATGKALYAIRKMR